MYLEKEKREQLYKLLFMLLDYTNNKYKINKKILGKINVNNTFDPADLLDIKEKLWENDDILYEYINKNPDKLKQEELEIIKSWKNRVQGNFIIVKYLKDYTILCANNKFYEIVGITNEISEIIPSSTLPIFVNAVLLPFDGKITYDTFMMQYQIKLMRGIKSTCNREYAVAKREGNVITCLDNNKKENNKQTNKKKNKYYEIKVSIRDTHPPVWRRLKIPSVITFHELNAIIQMAFGWCGYHLYSFEVGATLHGNGIFIEAPSFEDSLYEAEDSTKLKIDRYFEQYTRMKYVYDFGDNWVHDIVIEKIVETDKKINEPICIKAKMANLPEDCGGTYGYEELLEILSDREHEQYEDMTEWLEFTHPDWNDNRTYVDIEWINDNLQEYKEHAKFLLRGDM